MVSAPEPASQASSRRLSAAAPGSSAPAIERDAATSTDAGESRERRTEVARATSLRPDPGYEEDRARHQLPQPRQESGLGRADDRPHPAEAGAAREPVGALGDERGDPLVERTAARLEVEQVGGARVRCPDEHEDPRPRGLRGVDERLERVRARAAGWR